jgi:hypothetical protein
MSWSAAKPHIACVASSSPAARAAQADLAARYDLVAPGDCDVRARKERLDLDTLKANLQASTA